MQTPIPPQAASRGQYAIYSGYCSVRVWLCHRTQPNPMCHHTSKPGRRCPPATGLRKSTHVRPAIGVPAEISQSGATWFLGSAFFSCVYTDVVLQLAARHDAASCVASAYTVLLLLCCCTCLPTACCCCCCRSHSLFYRLVSNQTYEQGGIHSPSSAAAAAVRTNASI